MTHRSTPSVGGSVKTLIGADFETAQMRQEYRDRYCVDAPFLRAARAI